MDIIERGRIAQWSKEKLNRLSTIELRQLLANAQRLQEAEVAALCHELLDERPRGHAVVRQQRPKGRSRRLLTRGKAFEAHGITLRSRVWSRSGVRSDGAVVFAIWADGVQKVENASQYLLWAPNVAGSRPWSDKPGGKERLEHCRLALERGAAEGLLVYGKAQEGSLPEDKAASVDGMDAERVLPLQIEKRGEEYWATWTQEKRVLVRTVE